MLQPILGKAKLKAVLEDLGCASELDAWRKAHVLEDELAARIGALAEGIEGAPQLRELEGYLFLITEDDEFVYVFQDTRGARHELLGHIFESVLKSGQVAAHVTETTNDDNGDDNYPDADVDYDDDQCPRVQKPNNRKQ